MHHCADGLLTLSTCYDVLAWCPYCEKVWLYLEEKQIPYRIVKVPLRCYGDKPRSFLQLNPSGGLPVAVIRGICVVQPDNESIIASIMASILFLTIQFLREHHG